MEYIAPMISVLMPAYNAERYIARAIRSVLNQKDVTGGYEIIVVDDGCTDRTAEAIQPFKSSIRLLANKNCQGLPSALNMAIKQARGKYIVRVDADDYVSSDYLYILQRFLEANHDFDSVACDYIIVDNNENVVCRKNCETDPIGCGIMFRSDHLIDIGLYDNNFLMHEDADLRLRFTKKYSIKRIELPLYRYRKHDANMTNDANMDLIYRNKLIEKHSADAASEVKRD